MRVYVAPQNFADALEIELGPKILKRAGRLFFTDDEVEAHWAQNIWLDVHEFKFESISQAARHLRAIQRNWALHPTESHRRAQLIQEQLPPIKFKPIEFPSEIPKAPMGAWTLLNEKTMVYSAGCSSPYPDGELNFAENKTEPPSRAYLKLWETFQLEQKMPRAGDRVLDLGSSPGGWTWVLDQLGCEVISVDKAPLSADVNWSSRVRYVDNSAFALEPSEIGKVDWLFSDIICYPERLFKLVEKWEGYATNMVCTLKFQGPSDYLVTKDFLKLGQSHIRHLSVNKHELTWIRY